jgi:hypothetical protein
MKTNAAPEFDDPLRSGDEASRRALALLWLADSSPLAAAPPDALPAVRARLSLDTPAAPRRRPWRVISLAGWAAAACLAVLLWQRPEKTPEVVAQPPVKEKHVRPRTVVPDKHTAPESSAPEAGTVQPLNDPAALRRQLVEMKESLKTPPTSPPGTHRPVIRELLPPGAASSAAGGDRVFDLLANALESDLTRRSATGHARELIIESGWANWTAALPPDTTFRHRSFPAARWQELGLLKGEGGQFLDPATGWLWSPDPDSTDYTGRIAPTDLDRTAFTRREEEQTVATTTATPAGWLLTGANGETIISLNNLPSVPLGSSVRFNTFDTTGSMISYGLPDATITTEGWDFSGFIPAGSNTDFDRGFTLEVLTPTGGSNVILGTVQP